MLLEKKDKTELQITFKEEILKSPKDLDDALHIKVVAKEYLDDKLIHKLRVMLSGCDWGIRKSP